MSTRYVPGVGKVIQPKWFDGADRMGGGEGGSNERTPHQDFPGGDDRGQVVGARRPENVYQALMETAPGDTVPDTESDYRNEANRKGEIVQKVLNDPKVLTDLERLVIQLGHFEGKSVRGMTEVLLAMREAGVSPTSGAAKSHLHRVGKRAMKKLEAALNEHMSDIYPTKENT